MKKFLEWAKEIIIAVIIAAIILTFIKPIVIRQTSMEPTFHNGDYIFVSKQSYKMFGEMKRGDVIVFHTRLQDNFGKDKNLIKRIIGLPGDTIEITGGYTYLNGELLDEPYIKEQGIQNDMAPVTVGEGQVFACGDNRGVSLDSRDPSIGCVSQDEILGKVALRLYPFNQIQRFK